MLSFDPFAWTGRKANVRGEHSQGNVSLLERASVPDSPAPMPALPKALKAGVKREYLTMPDTSVYDGYKALANEIGMHFHPPFDEDDLLFRQYLLDGNWTTYNLPTVARFMDRQSKTDGAKHGWGWKALRRMDEKALGHAAWGHVVRYGGESDSPSSNGYMDNHSGVYEKPVPMHALEKVKAMTLGEGAYKGRLAFLVSDYSPAPQIRPDPFLMVVVLDARGAKSNPLAGKYVIDVWDEPNFGIDLMVKSGL